MGLNSDECIRACNSVNTGADLNPFDCYWKDNLIFPDECKAITTSTSCSDLSQATCDGTNIINCKWDSTNNECIESTSGATPPPSGPTGCAAGEYPYYESGVLKCGNTAPSIPSGYLNNGICDSNEVCGYSDCIHKIGKGGCQIDLWCGDPGSDGTSA